MLRGFIDESHDANPVPKVFVLACIVSDDSMWFWFELGWQKVLDEKNVQLRAKGRKEISRYHAADCSNSRGEFKGWSVDEQIEFCTKLFDVFRRHGVHFHSFDMPLQLLVQEIPETKSNPVGFAYVVLLEMLMNQIGENTLRIYKKDVISLDHDQSEYDAPLKEHFDYLINNNEFRFGRRFVSLTSLTSKDRIALQAADMIAYENFKEGMRYHYPAEAAKKRRKSLEILVDLASVSGRASGFGIDAIRALKKSVDALSPEVKASLFKTARIKP